MELIISGYGSKPVSTLGLYKIEKDKPISIEWQDTIENASFVCQGEGYFYTVTEAEDYAWVYAYKREGNQYRLIDQRKLEGGSLCHLTYSLRNEALFGACYGTGTVFSVRVREGKFGEILFHEIQQGANPSDLTRAHCVLLNQDESTLIVTNIALDNVYFYLVNEGRLHLTQVIALPKGVGPRHALLSQDEKSVYIITEYSNEIFVYQNDQSKQLKQRISTLQKGYCGDSYCSTLCFSKNGAYLYAANRGADTIVLFAVEENGELQKSGEFSCEGKYPRHMILSEDGDYLIVCNQYSDEVVIFELDVHTGYIRSSMERIDFKAPSGCSVITL